MSELTFRIILVPKFLCDPKDNSILLSEVKQKVQNCDLNVTSINLFQIKKDQDDYPEIEEFIVQIHAKTGASYPVAKYKQYQTFCSLWRKQTVTVPCSYIVLDTDDSFISPRRAQTTMRYSNISLGVLPHDGFFHNYASLSVYNRDEIYFYHDTRNVILKHGIFHISFTYANIRNIYVNIQRYAVEMYFDLFNPPIIHRVIGRYNSYSRESYISKYRYLNLKADEFMDPEIDVDILGRANVIRLDFLDHENSRKAIDNIHYKCSGKAIFYANISTVDKSRPVDPVIDDDMDFDSLYLLTAMMKRNFTLVSQAPEIYEQLAKVKGFCKKNPAALEKALTDVLLAMDSGKVLNYWSSIESRFNHYLDKKNSYDFKEAVVPPKCCLTRRITLTPTRMLLWPKELLFGNRVVRNFHSEFAIRVTFRDDNMIKLSSVAPYSDHGVLESSIKEPMEKGLSIGSRHYQFLGWSNSQIRDHGVWMYARDPQGRTSADIRTWMGDFSHIHNVPKYMARMGQCFSQTEVTVSVPLDPFSVRTVPDIVAGYDPENLGKPYNFSDGIGRISTELAKKVHEALGHDKLCSAFQIRYGGYKGMLVTDPTLKDVQIEFRESMKKFNCPNTQLEIAKASSPIPLQLNRPFIAILNDLGVRHRVFLRLQENMLKAMTDMLFEEEEAVRCLRSTPIGIYDCEELSKSGIHLTTEPFFRMILLALHRHKINCLKSRANVSIDPNYGRNMFGVLDETGTLNYGQVFVQYSNDISKGETTTDTTILEGRVLVTKNPCHFPGDVRKFEAVDVPQLHHIVDCIVFPRRGPRPHPNEMAGSDLDGDEYTVLWLPELLFFGPNRDAAHFPSMKSPDVASITVPDMIDSLQDYIAKDQIGSISYAHLAHADMQGIDSPMCIQIAKKISIAVDFAKTGNIVALDKEERPKTYPDFMEKYHMHGYKSKKALGKMYRICKDYETENEETATMYLPVKVDPDLSYPGWRKYKNDAIKARNKYNSILGSLLRNYGIEHESEVLSGAFTKLHCRFHERKDRMEIKKVIIVCLQKLSKDTFDEFISAFPDYSDGTDMVEAMLKKASAYYMVTYSDQNAKYLSFPWSVAKFLSHIKIRKRHSEPKPPFSPAIMQLDKKIRECESINLLPIFRDEIIKYEILCGSQILKQAVQVLIFWAQDEEIIDASGIRSGFLYRDVFIKLILHVAEKCCYVTEKNVLVLDKPSSFSPGKLCIEFLKFCSSLRFYNTEDVFTVVPFKVYKHSRLAKRAVVSYHRFALSGKFRNLYFDTKLKDDFIDMEPFYISCNVFPATPVSPEAIRKAQEALVKYSKAENVILNASQQTKRIRVSAWGSERALKDLKTILRKGNDILRRLFRTGIMPESVIDLETCGVKRASEGTTVGYAKKFRY